MKFKPFQCVVLACLCVWLGSVCLAVKEPNDIVGSSYSTFGTFEDHQPCGWKTVVNRKSTDETDERLIVDLDTCQVWSYTVTSVEQGSPQPDPVDLEPDDVLIVWDENAGDENREDFDFTGQFSVETPEYMRVSSTDDDIIHWKVRRVTHAGTLTIWDSPCCNEHDVICLGRNIMAFWKDDGIEEPNCVSENDEIVYQICFDNAYGDILEDAFVVDWLPDGVDYPEGEYRLELIDPNEDPPFILWPPDPDYTPRPDHCYTWYLDQIDPNTSGCLELRVVVNDKAVPGGYLHNVAELYGLVMVSDPNDPNSIIPVTQLVARAVVDTFVCCDPYPITTLYVDKNAVSGGKTGLNWENAFTDLQSALERALDTTCGQVDTILVAQGTYLPGQTEDDSFVLSENLSLFGGYSSGGSDRDPKKYKTVLSGLIDPNTLTRADTVVTMADETLLDGFTVTESASAFLRGSIYGSGVDFTITNCKIEKNDGYGAYIEDGNATFQWCRMTNNKLDGIRHSGSDCTLTLENCWIRRSGQHGVYCLNSTPTILNSILTESDVANEGRAGILMANPAYQPVLQNVTCAHNKTEGIALAGSTLPTLKNCIVYHNGGPSLAGFSAEQAAQYSCIQDCNEVYFNINDDPEFVYFDPNNVHIGHNSPCKDAGSPALNYDNQVDMDSRARVLGIYADMGAYEIDPDCEDDYNELDWNHDGLVNFHEYAKFSRAWLSYDPNHPSPPSDPNVFVNWNPACDLVEDLHIDLWDLWEFVDDYWLWRACWLTDDYLFEMMSGGGEMLMFMPEGVVSAQTVTPAQAGAEMSVAEQIARLTNSIIFLERIRLEEPDFQDEIDVEAWNEFMDALYQELVDLYLGND